MFPLAAPSRSFLPDDWTRFARAYRDAVVYDGPDPDDVLYEGPLIVHLNGWLELEGDRLLSPSAVHHVDVYDDHHVDVYDEVEEPEESERFGESGSGDDGGAGDRYRTNRFSPR